MSGIAGEGCEILVPFNERKSLQDIERSLVKTYRKHVWSKFIKAIKDYKLVEEGDKVAVAISGGKDSLIMAKLFQELKRHGQINFDLEFIAMDPGYHPHIKELLIDNCNYLNIPIHIYESGIFEVVDRIAKDYPCYMCARMRRGSLYAKAKELGCNKMALGHHFNDVIETTMLNILYAGNFKTMLPKLKSSNFQGMELIRPLYYIEEKYIKRWVQNAGIWPLNCACMVAAKKIGNKRFEIKDFIEEFKLKFNDVDKSIFRAAENVSIDSILGWDIDGKDYSYLDFYDEESLLFSVGQLKQDMFAKEAIINEKRKIAKNLIGILADEVIAEKTGLTLKDIASLKN
ncbi:tRNA 2-thiocytidine biosynthesis protein TtcA [Clostridium tarantellae]|uniref:tRNA 2-thiocytidine biosynthesis protein TtcA n=1 Tax=Clostridium tarantellae TaxID=39493 RepID=A0A6I1MLY8_9CLOT|nr:tRNA 2-thiocytidine biosynthesis protein TtcA [Clostridium tarantellae]